MPTLDLDNNQSAVQIRSFKPGMIQVNDQILTHSVIVTPDKLLDNWPPQTIQELTAQHLKSIIELKPDILLLGTGSTQVFIALDIYGELVNLGIGVEIMDSSAACRTFNALSAENRNVAAAVIIR